MLWGCQRKPLYDYNRMCSILFIHYKIYLEHFQFSVLLTVIFALEIGAGIAAYVRRGEVETMLENKLNSTMFDYYKNEDIQKSWDIAQHEVGCRFSSNNRSFLI